MPVAKRLSKVNKCSVFVHSVVFALGPVLQKVINVPVNFEKFYKGKLWNEIIYKLPLHEWDLWLVRPQNQAQIYSVKFV